MLRTARYALLATALFATTALAGARDELKTFTTGLKGLDGQFTQKVYDGGGKLRETSNGRVALSAPRLFRWEYNAPYEQLIVADGKQVWVYDPDLQQATVREQGIEEENSPLAALIDPGKLDRQFKVAEAAGQGGVQWLTLTPKNEGEASFQTARLAFANWRACIISADASLPRLIRLSASKKTPLFNGALECRLYEYKLVAGSNR